MNPYGESLSRYSLPHHQMLSGCRNREKADQEAGVSGSAQGGPSFTQSHDTGAQQSLRDAAAGIKRRENMQQPVRTFLFHAEIPLIFTASYLLLPVTRANR